MPFSPFRKTKPKSQNVKTVKSPRKMILPSPSPSPTKTIPEYFKSSAKPSMPLSRKSSVRKEQICTDNDVSVQSDSSTVEMTPPKSVKRPLLESYEPSKRIKFSLDNNVQIVYKNLQTLSRIHHNGSLIDDPIQKEKYLKDSIAEIFKKTKNPEIPKDIILKNLNSELSITPVKNALRSTDLNLDETENEVITQNATPIKQGNTQNLATENTSNPINIQENPELIDLTDSETLDGINEILTRAQIHEPTNNKENAPKVLSSMENIPSKELPPITNSVLNIIPIKTVKSPKKTDSPYSDVLLYCINKARIYSPSIFDDYANKICSKYKTLHPQERILYQNLLCRKWDWIRRDSITYSYISDVPGALESLMLKGFIQPIDSTCDFDDILWSMSVNELNDLHSAFITGKKGKKSKKEELINSLKSVANRQGFQFKSSSISVKEKMISKAIEGKKSIKLSQSTRDLFFKMIISSTCPFYKGDEDSRLSSLRIKFKRLQSNETKLYPLDILADKLFLNTNTFEKYYNSVVLKSSLQDAKLKKDWSLVSDLCMKIKTEFDTFMLSEYNFTLLNDHSEFYHRKKFMAGSNLAYCLSSSIDVLKRERRYDFAIECLDGLLNQNHFVKRRRAKWYEAKILIFERYRKQTPEVIYQLLIDALQDDNLTHLGKRIISKKALSYAQPKGRKISNDKKDKLQKLLIYPTSTIEAIDFNCKSMPNVTTSKKQIFVEQTDEGQVYSTVEEIAIGHFKKEYPICLHDEGSLLKKLTLGLFFPVIVENVQGMFVSELQDLPLDWGGERFFKAREDKFEAHKEMLVQGGEETIEMELYSNQAKLENTVQNEWINLKTSDIPNLFGLLKCITIEKFMKFAFYLLQNFSERKSGLPDLTMYNINDKKCAFIEVKGPSDTASQNQILWMEKLQEFGLISKIFKVSCAISPKPKPVPLIEETQD